MKSSGVHHKTRVVFRKPVDGMAIGRFLSQSMLTQSVVSRSQRHEEWETLPAPEMPGGSPTVKSSTETTSLSKNLNRLLCAALVSPHFQKLLLTDPVAALSAGYNGESFHLTPAEYAIVTTIRVTNVRDFATQLLHRLHHAPAEHGTFSPEMQAELRLSETRIR